MKMLFALYASLMFVPNPRLAANEADRYLESTTVAVAQLDLARIDLAATTKFIQTSFPGMLDANAIGGFQLVAGGMIGSLRGAGVTNRRARAE